MQRLNFTTTSLHNVVISNASDVIFYEVVTPRWAPALTRVHRLDPNAREFNLVGELQNEGARARPVAVRLYGYAAAAAASGSEGAGFKPAEGFLKREQGERAELCASFVGKDGRTYRWRATKRDLELVRDDTPDKPVAVYHRQKRFLYVLRMSRLPCLEIDRTAMDTLDSLIVSFLLIERQRRDAGLR